MSPNQFYSVTTRRFTLRSNHDDWLKLTQDLYNEVLLFYYNLFLKLEEEQPDSLMLLSSQQILRKLEVLTVLGREKIPVPHPLPWNKIPLYFRRAAINGAISSAKSHFSRMNVEKKQLSTYLLDPNEAVSFDADIDSAFKSGCNVGKASQFKNGVTFYKGTYRDLKEGSVSLKVWNGSSWQWLHCRLSGNFVPGNAELMSPTILYGQGGMSFYLPVKLPVLDGRKAKERIVQEVRVCSLQFTNENYFAVGVVMDGLGQQGRIRFFKGGREYESRCGEILSKIRSSEKSMGLSGPGRFRTDRQSDEKLNYRYWMKLKHISEYYAHSVSKQVIQFCNENQVKVIILPKYNEKFKKYVMIQSGTWSPVHLSNKIREMLSYKAWQAGIIILEVNPGGTSSVCEKCGALLKKKKDAFICANGHQGNKFVNSARNLGRKCLNSFSGEKTDVI